MNKKCNFASMQLREGIYISNKSLLLPFARMVSGMKGVKKLPVLGNRNESGNIITPLIRIDRGCYE